MHTRAKSSILITPSLQILININIISNQIKIDLLTIDGTKMIFLLFKHTLVNGLNDGWMYMDS